MTDNAIIHQVLAGDVEAFARLVDAHYDRCARIAYRILGNREDAEEAVQDAFLRAYRALGSYEDRERFSSWLSRILVNQCRTHVRARASERADVQRCGCGRRAVVCGRGSGGRYLARPGACAGAASGGSA